MGNQCKNQAEHITVNKRHVLILISCIFFFLEERHIHFLFHSEKVHNIIIMKVR